MERAQWCEFLSQEPRASNESYGDCLSGLAVSLMGRRVRRSTQHEADRGQPHVLPFASALYLSLYCSASLFHTTITDVSFSITASAVKRQQRSHTVYRSVAENAHHYTHTHLHLGSV